MEKQQQEPNAVMEAANGSSRSCSGSAAGPAAGPAAGAAASAAGAASTAPQARVVCGARADSRRTLEKLEQQLQRREEQQQQQREKQQQQQREQQQRREEQQLQQRREDQPAEREKQQQQQHAGQEGETKGKQKKQKKQRQQQQQEASALFENKGEQQKQQRSSSRGGAGGQPKEDTAKRKEKREERAKDSQQSKKPTQDVDTVFDTPLPAVLIAITFREQQESFAPIHLDRPLSLLSVSGMPLLTAALDALTYTGATEIMIVVKPDEEGRQVRQLVESFSSSCQQRTRRLHQQLQIACVEVPRSVEAVGDVLRELFHQNRPLRSDFLLMHVSTFVRGNLKAAVRAHQQRVEQRSSRSSDPVVTQVFAVAAPGSLQRQMEDEFAYIVAAETQQLLERVPLQQRSRRHVFLDQQLFSRLSSSAGNEQQQLQVHFDWIDVGVYVCSPRVLEMFSTCFDYKSMNGDFIPDVLKGELGLDAVYVHPLELTDGEVQTPFAACCTNPRLYYLTCKQAITRWSYPLKTLSFVAAEQPQLRYKGHGTYQADSVCPGLRCMLGPCAALEADIVIGDDTHICNSFVGARSSIGSNVLLENCICFEEVKVGNNCRLKDCLLARGCEVEEGATLLSGCILGPRVRVAAHALLPANTRLCVPPAAAAVGGGRGGGGAAAASEQEQQREENGEASGPAAGGKAKEDGAAAREVAPAGGGARRRKGRGGSGGAEATAEAGRNDDEAACCYAADGKGLPDAAADESPPAAQAKGVAALLRAAAAAAGAVPAAATLTEPAGARADCSAAAPAAALRQPVAAPAALGQPAAAAGVPYELKGWSAEKIAAVSLGEGGVAASLPLPLPVFDEDSDSQEEDDEEEESSEESDYSDSEEETEEEEACSSGSSDEEEEEDGQVGQRSVVAAAVGSSKKKLLRRGKQESVGKEGTTAAGDNQSSSSSVKKEEEFKAEIQAFATEGYNNPNVMQHKLLEVKSYRLACNRSNADVLQHAFAVFLLVAAREGGPPTKQRWMELLRSLKADMLLSPFSSSESEHPRQSYPLWDACLSFFLSPVVQRVPTACHPTARQQQQWRRGQQQQQQDDDWSEDDGEEEAREEAEDGRKGGGQSGSKSSGSGNSDTNGNSKRESQEQSATVENVFYGAAAFCMLCEALYDLNLLNIDPSLLLWRNDRLAAANQATAARSSAGAGKPQQHEEEEEANKKVKDFLLHPRLTAFCEWIEQDIPDDEENS